MRVAAALLFALVGIVNLVPVAGALSPERVQGLYGVAFQGPDLALLLRHRALLFAVVGGLLMVAAFQPRWRAAAALAGAFSMLSFVVLAWIIGNVTAELRRVAMIDVVASVLLFVGFLLDRRLPRAGTGG